MLRNEKCEIRFSWMLFPIHSIPIMFDLYTSQSASKTSSDKCKPVSIHNALEQIHNLAPLSHT